MALCKGGKLRSLGDKDGRLIGYGFNCPGCDRFHAVYTELHYRPQGVWTFNGDTERPTFSPSLLVTWNEGPERAKRVCHSFIRDGQIQFLSDCTHALAGQTVDIPLWEREFQDNHDVEEAR